MNIEEIYKLSRSNAKTIMLYLRNENNLNDFIKETSYLPEYISKSERYYCWLNNLKEIPKCPICGKYKKFRKVNLGYFATCGDKSCKSTLISKSNSDHEKRDWNKIQEKMKSTYKEKTGYEHNMQNPEFKKEFFEKYKNEHNGQSCGVQSDKAIQHHKQYLKVRKSIKNNLLIEKLRNINFTFIAFNNKNSSSLKLKCNKCNHLFDVSRYYCLHKLEQNLYNFCPNCDLLQQKSLFEQSICTEIKKLYNGNILFNNRLLFGIECDIIIPEFKLGIECNGLYWHSEKFRDKFYHINKKKQIEQNNYILIQIWEDLWMNTKKHKSIINLIKSKLNLIKNNIDISQCNLQYNLKNIDIKGFIDDYSLEDFNVNENDNILYIFYNNNLVKLIIFNIENNIINIQLECIKHDLIINDNNDIIKNQLMQKFNVNKIYIKSNADYTSLYDKNIIRIIEPNCWYVKNIHRYKYELNNSYKLYDSGQIIYNI